MFIILSRFFGTLANPATLLAILTLAAGIAMLGRRWRLATWLQGMSVTIVLFFGVLPGADWLAVPLEARFPSNPALPPNVTGIIALGGTERLEQSAAWGQPTLSDPAPIATLVNLGRRYPGAKLAFTGGLRAKGDMLSEADIVRQFVNEMGADGAAMLYDDRARNTHENAVFSRELLHPKPGERWILICQAIGMPRAVGVFRHEGWDVIPYPAGYLSGNKGVASFSFDLLDGLNLGYIAAHEWVGLIVYRLLGYTDQVFPN